MYLDPEDWTKKYFVSSAKIVQNLTKSSSTQGRFRKALPSHCETFGPKTMFYCHSSQRFRYSTLSTNGTKQSVIKSIIL
jgi:hypothetical protein